MGNKRLSWQMFSSFLVVAVPAMLVAGPLLRRSPVPFALEVFLAILLAAWGSSWVSRRVARPLETITTGVRRLAEDQWPGRLARSGDGELCVLTETLNRMAEHFHERILMILRSQNEQEAMLGSMEEGVLAVDMQGRIINLNQACATLLGTDAGKVRGRIVHETIRKPDLLDLVDQALAGHSPVECDLCMQNAGDRWLHVHGTTLHDGEHQRIGALVVLHDTTRLRRLENVRRDFVANVSHELRTPVTSIKGFVETLLDGAMDDPESTRRFLRIVLRQANRLNAIIEDLLTLSRIERGTEEVTIELGEDSVGEVLQAAIEMCQQSAADKGISLHLDCPPTLPLRMNAHLLEQAVVNLVGNAVKYSEPGSTVHIGACQDGGDIVIQVKDRGCGIEAKHLPRLFERFYRVDKARSRELGGTGLGLAIVKHIALAHRGAVEVESAVGHGSTFSIRLPASGSAVC